MKIRLTSKSIEVDFTLDRYSIFQGRLFFQGRISSVVEERIVALRLLLGSSVDFSLSAFIASKANGRECWSFSENIPIADCAMSDLFSPRLQVTFLSGVTGEIQQLTNEFLGQETWWKTANLFLSKLKEFDCPGNLLEIGARARSGVTRRHVTPIGWSYTGLDILPGENVDVVGDAHELSSLFPESRFDAVMAFAVLEHILMPWKLVLELNRVLKPGAFGLFVTHQAWPVHEQPWDFWRYSSWAWHALLNSHTGFEVLETRMAEPASLVAQVAHVAVNHGDVACYQSSSVVFRKVGTTRLDWPVRSLDITKSLYPE